MDKSCVLYEFHGLQIVLRFSETLLKMRQKTFHIYTIKSFYSYARVSTIVLFSSHHFFFMFKVFKPMFKLQKVVQSCWEHVMGRNFLFNFIPLLFPAL